MRGKVLVVEDDCDISEIIGSTLVENGYGVDYAYSGTEAIMLYEKSQYDLMILDLMLPGLSGEEIVKRVGDSMPVIIVSAKIGIDDKVNNLLNGAADYLTKPFNKGELLARVAVQMRKAASGSGTVKRYGDVYIDVNLNTAFAGGTPLKLTKTEFAVLNILISNPKRIFSKAQLADCASDGVNEVWESSLNVHVHNLRKKIFDACGKTYIEAVWGIGYRLHCEKT